MLHKFDGPRVDVFEAGQAGLNVRWDLPDPFYRIYHTWRILQSHARVARAAKSQDVDEETLQNVIQLSTPEFPARVRLWDLGIDQQVGVGDAANEEAYEAQNAYPEVTSQDTEAKYDTNVLRLQRNHNPSRTAPNSVPT